MIEEEIVEDRSVDEEEAVEVEEGGEDLITTGVVLIKALLHMWFPMEHSCINLRITLLLNALICPDFLNSTEEYTYKTSLKLDQSIKFLVQSTLFILVLNLQKESILLASKKELSFTWVLKTCFQLIDLPDLKRQDLKDLPEQGEDSAIEDEEASKEVEQEADSTIEDEVDSIEVHQEDVDHLIEDDDPMILLN